MSKRVPAIQVTVDGTSYTGFEGAVATAQVDVGMGQAIDRARLVLGWLSPFADVEPGAEVEVGLGYGDEITPVLTGDVDTVAQRPWGLVVDVLAQPVRLTQLRIGTVYINTSPADIVSDLVSQAGAATGQVEDPGFTMAAYHVDERRHAWAHVQDLARVTASQVSTEPDGSLNFKRAPGAESGGLGAAIAGAAASLLGLGGGMRYGAELHDWALTTSAPDDTSPAVFAHGAASELGADKWHVLVKEPAGSSPSGPVAIPPAVRDRDGASQLEAATSDAASRAATGGWVAVTGDAALRAGDTVEISEMPVGDNPSLRVRCLTHHYGEDTGFVTHLETEGAAA